LHIHHSLHQVLAIGQPKAKAFTPNTIVESIKLEFLWCVQTIWMLKAIWVDLSEAKAIRWFMGLNLTIRHRASIIPSSRIRKCTQATTKRRAPLAYLSNSRRRTHSRKLHLHGQSSQHNRSQYLEHRLWDRHLGLVRHSTDPGRWAISIWCIRKDHPLHSRWKMKRKARRTLDMDNKRKIQSHLTWFLQSWKSQALRMIDHKIN
jgi:hypothetical protein